MPASAGVPLLSQVRGWSPDYLTNAAGHWEQTARTWGDAYDRAFREVQSPGGTQWTGAGADAAVQRVGSDRLQVVGAVEDLHATAAAARTAAADLTAARANVLDAIAAAQADGFSVGEDYSIRSFENNLSPAAAAARQALAQTHATAIRSEVFALAALDQESATSITAAATGVQAMTFGAGGAPQSPVQAVDWKTGPPLPQEPAPNDPGLPQPPGGWSTDPVMEDAQRIAYGHAWDKHLTDFPGMTQDQLAELVHGMLTGDPRTDPDLQVGQIPGRSSTAIWKDGILVIHDPLTGDGGTIYRPTNGFNEYLKWVGGGAGAAPIISAPPNIPPTVPHPTMGPMPLQPPHTPVTLPPSSIFDPSGLPPWLANPSPPAMPYAPQGPTIFPNMPLQSGPVGAPTPGPGLMPHIDMPHINTGNISADLANAGQASAPAAAAGGLSLAALLALLALSPG